MHRDPTLAWLETNVAAIRRLIEIDRRSRVMLTFMTAHMKETTGALGVEPLRYFEACYGDVAQEFLQAAENSFVTHHCLRVLFVHWMEEIDRLRGGGVGRALAALDAPIPALDRDVVPPGRPIVPFGYESVRSALSSGKLPPPASPANPMLEPSRSTFSTRDDRIFGALCVESANDWAEEVVILWSLVRSSIALDDGAPVAGRRSDYRDAVDAFARLYGEWRAAHVESTRIHADLFRLFSGGMFGFVGERFAGWTISPPLLGELYLEAAQAIAALRGEPGAWPEIPAPRYWRRTPWTSERIRPDAEGLPPF